MASLIENNLPYKLYSAVNLGSKEGMFYLGKVPSTKNYTQKVYSDDFYQNCFSGYYFSIASLVPGSCVRMDIADEVDSNILIDAKWYDFRPCGATTCNSSDWQKDNILHSVDYSDPMKVKPLFKSLTTDGTVVISGLESSFIWNDMGVNDARQTSHCTLYLQAWKYKFANVCEYYPSYDGIGTFYGTIGTPGQTDVIFLMKSFIGGKNIRIRDLGSKLKIDYIASRCEGENIQLPSPPIVCEPYIPASVGEFI